MPRRPPPRRPNSGGLGNPYEEAEFYSGNRDFGSGEPNMGQTQDLIYDPAMDPTTASPEVKKQQNEFWARTKEELKEMSVFTKEPAFISPPFFSRPKIKLRRATVAAAGAPGAPNVTILDWDVESRQHWVCTSIGVETDNTAIAQNGLVQWRFTVNGVVNQLFDDQTRGIIDPPGDPDAGTTTRIPGSLAVPFSLRENGLVFQVSGPANILLTCQNSNPVLPANDIIVTAMISFYEYWMPDNTTHTERGQYQR